MFKTKKDYTKGEEIQILTESGWINEAVHDPGKMGIYTELEHTDQYGNNTDYWEFEEVKPRPQPEPILSESETNSLESKAQRAENLIERLRFFTNELEELWEFTTTIQVTPIIERLNLLIEEYKKEETPNDHPTI